MATHCAYSYKTDELKRFEEKEADVLKLIQSFPGPNILDPKQIFDFIDIGDLEESDKIHLIHLTCKCLNTNYVWQPNWIRKYQLADLVEILKCTHFNGYLGMVHQEFSKNNNVDILFEMTDTELKNRFHIAKTIDKKRQRRCLGTIANSAKRIYEQYGKYLVVYRTDNVGRKIGVEESIRFYDEDSLYIGFYSKEKRTEPSKELQSIYENENFIAVLTFIACQLPTKVSYERLFRTCANYLKNAEYIFRDGQEKRLTDIPISKTTYFKKLRPNRNFVADKIIMSQYFTALPAFIVLNAYEDYFGSWKIIESDHYQKLLIYVLKAVSENHFKNWNSYNPTEWDLFLKQLHSKIHKLLLSFAQSEYSNRLAIEKMLKYYSVEKNLDRCAYEVSRGIEVKIIPDKLEVIKLQLMHFLKQAKNLAQVMPEKYFPLVFALN